MYGQSFIKTYQSSSYILSKDAYMLIYARLPTVSCDKRTITNGKSAKSSAKRNGAAPDMKDPTPPDRAIEVIDCLNATHDRACQAYDERQMVVLPWEIAG